MKKLLTILFFFTSFVSFAAGPKNYYISNTGNDSADGLTSGTPWLTIAKVNASMGLFVAGDSILFKSGDTFYGSVVMTKNGVSGLPIVVGSYGSGPKPIISGLTTLSTWTLVSTGIYQASAPAVKATVNLVTVNGLPQAVGRYPNADATNAGYLSYETYSGIASITDNQLTTTPNNWTGAQIVVRKNHWHTEKLLVTAHSGGTLSYTTTPSINPLNNGTLAVLNGTNGYGYYIQRDVRTLDQLGEWYFNDGTKKMQMFFGANSPGSYIVKVATQDTLINLTSHQFITVNNLALDGAGMFGVYAANGSTITVKNCNITNSGGKAILIFNSPLTDVENCFINYSLCSGIDLTSRHFPTVTVRNCIVKNTGTMVGMGAFFDDNDHKGISANVTTGGLIELCEVDTTGHAGIQFQGNNFTVQNNLVQFACMQKDDAGGIYTYQSGTDAAPGTTYANRKIQNNIILNMPGSPIGAGGNIDVEGIYLDGRTGNVDILNNTSSGIAGHGIYCNNPNTVNIIGNVCYSNGFNLGLTRYSWGSISNLVVKKNIFFSLLTTQLNIEYVNTGLNQPTPTTIQAALQALGTIDSNYYTTPSSVGFKWRYALTEGGTFVFPAGVSLEGWRSYTNHDLASIRSATDMSLINLHYNATSNSVAFNFPGLKKLEADQTNHSNSVNIPRWTGMPLIDNGASSNTAPVANAGSNQTVTLPTNFTTLSGSGTDADGSISSYQWVQLLGPSAAGISTPTAASTLITFLTQGVFQFQLTVTDNGGAIGSDVVQVTILPAPNVLPVVNAGIDQTINLPTNSVTLTATATDADGTISSYQWAKISGGFSTFATPAAASTLVNSLVAGVYQFQVTATDNSGGFAKDTIQVTVNPAPNTPPTANAGVDINLTLPTNSTTLAGSGTDAEGSVTYQWAKISGPSGGLTSATTSFAPISGLQQGTYQYQLTVTDNGTPALTATDLVNVIVSASPPTNTPPVSHAGSDITITLPTNSVNLAGFGTDVDGTIASVFWIKSVGPATGTIVTPSAGNSVFNNLVAGTYVLTLTVTDNDGATNGDAMQVIVNPAPVNQLPTVTAGGDQVITLPTNSVSLSSTATDADGTISTYSWVKILGPSATITTANAQNTTVTSMAAGTFKFEIIVTDNSGGQAKDTVQVIVNPAIPNVLPTVNAGADIPITLPINSVSVTATASDADGTISSYLWVKIGGPATGTILTPNAATTTINNLSAGQYFFQVTVTDNSGGQATDVMSVTVTPQAVNVVPVANAGPDQTLTLPTDFTTLSGSGTDSDGTIASYQWTEGATVLGTSASINLTGLTQGLHTFTLTVTDNSGGVGSDTVIVNVLPVPVVVPASYIILYHTVPEN